jgi:hypothetical protein
MVAMAFSRFNPIGSLHIHPYYGLHDSGVVKFVSRTRYKMLKVKVWS